jgi:indolepyruvate decarboxylase
MYRFGLAEVAMRFVESSGIPTTVTMLDKAAVEERHPSFIGVYAGALGREEVQEYVEGSDCLIILGTLLTDVNLGIFTARLDPARCIHATRDRLAIGLHTFEQVQLEDFVHGLANASLPKREQVDHPCPPLLPGEPVTLPESDEPITVEHLFERLATHLDAETIVIADPGDAMFGAIDMPVHGARAFLAPAFYASLGFAVPAAIGAQCARPDARPLVLVGDGAFQMTGMELSTCVRYALDPLVVVLNNAGYTTERLILDGQFNDVLPWDYSKLTEVYGQGRSMIVQTTGDLEEALAASAHRDGQFFLLDVRLSMLDVSPALKRLGERLNAAATVGV